MPSIPEPEREIDKPFLMARRRRLLDHRSRTVGHTPRIERGRVKGRRDRPDRRIKDTTRNSKRVTVCVENCSVSSSRKAWQVITAGLLLRGIQKEDIERGMVPGEAQLHQAPHQVRGEVVRAQKGGRRPPHHPLAGYRRISTSAPADVTGRSTAFTADDATNSRW